MSDRARIVSGAVWVAGRFVEEASELEPLARAGSSVRAEYSVEGLFPGDRIPRADRVTQIGALVLSAATRALPSIEPESLATITASMLATAHTNERFERRRMESKPPEPRTFPYTAPNAAAGEFSIAMHARGPTLTLVGGSAVGLVGVERACRWIARGMARRVVVVATECPPASPQLVAPRNIDPVECAAAVVLESVASQDARDVIDVAFTSDVERYETSIASLLSIGPLAAVWFASRNIQGARELHFASDCGAGLVARLGA